MFRTGQRSVVGRQLLLILPALAGAVLMVLSIHLSRFLSDFSALSLGWAAVLLIPYAFVGLLGWRSRPAVIPAVLVVLLALLLVGPPLLCFSDEFGEGSQYILVLAPIYLWCVVAVAAVLEIVTRRWAAAGVIVDG